MKAQIVDYTTEAKDLIRFHKKIYFDPISSTPSILIKYIIKSIDGYEKEYLYGFDRETLINEVKHQLNLK